MVTTSGDIMIIKIEGFFFRIWLLVPYAHKKNYIKSIYKQKCWVLILEIYLIYFVDFIILIDYVLKMTQRLVSWLIQIRTGYTDRYIDV